VPEDDAMETDSRSEWQGNGTLEELMRERIRATIETIVEEELDGALGAARSQRVGLVRVGYRHGKRARTLTASLGATMITMPRARIEDAQGQRREWHSRMIPRFQRRTQRVGEAILGVYLSGTNTRRLRGALAPLLRGGPLSKDAVSRLAGRLREDFEAWTKRDLGELKIRYLFLDGWYPRVRIGKKRVRVPVLVTLGVCANGQRMVLDLWAYHHSVRIDFSRRGKPTDNAFIETFNGTLRDECLNLHWFDDIAQARVLIEAWRRDYNESRPHMALGNLSPTEYATRTGTRYDTTGLNAAQN
jgi:transposase-like protein